MIYIPQSFMLFRKSKVNLALEKFTPNSITGLIQWGSTANTSDLNIVTTNKVNSVLDKSGNNKNATQPNPDSAFYPIYEANVQNGKGGLKFGGGSGVNLFTPDLFTGLTETTIFLVKKPYIPTPSIVASYSTDGFFSVAENDWKKIANYLYSSTSYHGHFGKGNGQVFCESFRYGGGKRAIGIDFRLLERNQSENLGMIGGLYLGTRHPNGFQAPIYLFEWLVYNRALSNSEYLKVIEYLKKEWGIASTENTKFNNWKFHCIGDSNTVGYDGTLGQANSLNYPNKLSALTGGGIWRNWGVVGDEHWQMSPRVNNSVIPLFDPNTTNVAILWGGTNDLAKTSTDGTVLAQNYKNIALSLKNAGFIVLMMTNLDQGGAFANASFQTRRQDFNNELKNNPSSYCNRLVDFTVEPLLSNTGACNNNIYFNLDKQHVTESAFDLMNTYIFPQINSL